MDKPNTSGHVPIIMYTVNVPLLLATFFHVLMINNICCTVPALKHLYIIVHVRATNVLKNKHHLFYGLLAKICSTMASTVLKLSKHASLTCVSLSKIIIHVPNVKTKASLNVDQEKAKVYQIC